MYAQKVFPTIVILLSLGACALYAYKGDVRHAIYWFSAAMLNAVVTY